MPSVFHLQRVIFLNVFKTFANRSISRQITQFVVKSSKKNSNLKKFIAGKSLALAGLTIRYAECRSKSTSTLRSESRRLPAPEVSWNDLSRLIKPYLHWLLTAVAAAILVAILNVRIPLQLGDLVNAISHFLNNKNQEQFGEINQAAINLLTSYVGQALFTFGYISFLSIMGEKMAADLRIRLFHHLLQMPMSFYDKRKVSDLSERLNFDVQEFKSCFKLCVSQGLRTATQIGGCLVSLYLISPTLTMATAGLLPIVILVGTAWGSALRHLSNKSQQQTSMANALADEALYNIRTVKSFNMEEYETELYEAELRKAEHLNIALGHGIGAFQAASNIFLNGVVLGVLYGGTKLMLTTSDLSAGDLMSFLVAAQTIQKSLTQLSIVFGSAIKGFQSLGRSLEYLKVNPERSTGQKRIPFHSLSGDVILNDVSFSYESRPDVKVLKNLSLQIPPAQTTALCGPSGSGKSTITALLLNLYKPTEGNIFLDGKDYRELSDEWIRSSAIGIISQEPTLFSTTIEENIRYGRPSATMEEIREAARLANADDFISNFPDGYQTRVGERGAQLSGGQKQRIAIARALLKNPPILILDEATSALDNESEALVQDALSKAMANRTVLVIAHRLSTIRNADKICVLKDGKLLEEGTHSELIKQRGAYYRLVESSKNKNGVV
ncbi:unnamed protein product [Bursaphelenchus okinawaensis]|uniref:Mitochondrial potassium channel ATP-binding subunit n=1 Tax=Bursaphelenchus okinawaensis TaxID=465554 RepID=A0A811KQW8_9BILA|nr:unnamed protein product [Bursaphelenchus okinawaensis]CAG9109456.1 unnamed protein product [Bursaphelenchus okinawaensis]